MWTLAGIALIVIAVMIWSSTRAGFFGAGAVSILGGFFYALSLIAFVLSGALIVSRQPKNIIGWLLMLPGLALPASQLIHNWLVALDPSPTTADLPVWLAIWFDTWSWILLIYPIFHLLLVFPNGRLVSSRWRWVVWLEVAMAAFMLSMATFEERFPVFTDDDVELWSVPNPIGFIPASFFGGFFQAAWSFGLVFLTVAGVTAFVSRFRKGSSIERQQLKWPLYAIALFGLVYTSTALTNVLVTGSPWDALFGLSLAAIPVSVAVAVLRYRLYDLDRIVSRTVTYLVVAVLLVGAYGMAVLGLGSFLGRDDPMAVAGATLAAAALFNPVRTRIRRWVDRRFNRPRFDAERVIDAFAATLRDSVDPDEVVHGWVGVVSETMNPATVGAWVRQPSA